MKLIFAIIQTDDTDNVVAILNQQGYMVTKLNSTGGFLRKGNSTLMIGIPEEKVNDVIRIFKEECGRRQQMMDPVPYMDNPIITGSPMVPMVVGGARVFVVDVERFEKV